MSQSLNLELSDAAYNALQCEAELTGLTPAQMAAMLLEYQFSVQHRPPENMDRKVDTRTEAEKEEARRRFEQHIGAVDLGYPTGVDNEIIDADLVREYADNHEED